MQFKKMDITTVERPALIAHGVNCQNRMGSGVAKALYEKWPEVKKAYHEFDNQSLDAVQFVKVSQAFHGGEEIWVANCFTQQNYGRLPGMKYADLKAVKNCLEYVCIWNNKADYPMEEIHIPRIGCGLGGLDWDEVEPVLFSLERKFGVEFIVCDL